jgi:hypothetical protein
VLADTDEVIEPAVLETAVPPAFHCQATYVYPLALKPVSPPEAKLNPPESNDDNPPEKVASAAVEFENRSLVTPRTESVKLLLVALFLPLIHTKSG